MNDEIDLEVENIRELNEPYIAMMLKELEKCSRELIGEKGVGSYEKFLDHDLFITELICVIVSLHVKNLKSSKLCSDEEASEWLVNLTINLKRALVAIADLDID